MLHSFPIGSLAQILTGTSTSTLTQAAFWLVAGVLLCSTELFLAKTLLANHKLAALSSGVVALIIGLFLAWSVIRDYPVVPSFEWQIAYWMVLSIICIIWVRPMLIKGKKFSVREATEAKTIAEILPGEIGRVLYEGSSWQARCEDRQVTILPNQKVYVVGREGTTLIVVPEDLLHS